MLEQVRGLHSNIVDIDNVQAAKEMTSFLVELGHQDIIHFAGPEDSTGSEERVKGFREVFFDSPLAYSEDLVMGVGARLDEEYRTGLKYFRDRAPSERPTATTISWQLGFSGRFGSATLMC